MPDTSTLSNTTNQSFCYNFKGIQQYGVREMSTISFNTADIWTSNQLSGKPQSLTDVVGAEVDKDLYRFQVRSPQ